MSLFKVIVFFRLDVRDLAMCCHTIEMCFVSEVWKFRAEYSDEPNVTYEKKYIYKRIPDEADLHDSKTGNVACSYSVRANEGCWLI